VKYKDKKIRDAKRNEQQRMVVGGGCERSRWKERELKFRVRCSVTVLQNSEYVGYSSGLSSATDPESWENEWAKQSR
jgi:hypothetical protein